MTDTTAVFRRRSTSILSAALASTFFLAACGSASSGEGESGTDGSPVTLRLADSFPPTHRITVEGGEVFMERATELSGGSIQFEHFPAEQLAGAADLLDAAADGVSDISYVGVAYHGDSLPLSDVGSLPGSFQRSELGSQAYWHVMEDSLMEKEFLPKGVRPVWAALYPPYNLTTTKVRVETLDDLKGLQIRAAGGTLSRMVQELGGTPVELAAPEIYQALQRGTIDGSAGPISSLGDYNLEEVLKYGTTNLSLGGFVITYVINEDVFQGLSQEQQDALTQAGEEAMMHLTSVFDEDEVTAAEELEAEGMDFYELADDEAERWNTAAKSVWDDWAAELDSQGLPGSETVDMWEDALEQVGAE